MSKRLQSSMAAGTRSRVADSMDLLWEAEVAVEPVTEAQARIARQAYSDFGKDGGHPAKLNFGDCFAYALAKTKREPLLFKGDDFLHTDVTRALPFVRPVLTKLAVAQWQ